VVVVVLFRTQGVLLAPGQSETLTFQMPVSTSLATVLENGDRVFFPGEYTVTFSRGHGTNLTKQVTVAAAAAAAKGGEGGVESSAPVMLSKFPSRWVDGARKRHACFLAVVVPSLSWQEVIVFQARSNLRQRRDQNSVLFLPRRA